MVRITVVVVVGGGGGGGVAVAAVAKVQVALLKGLLELEVELDLDVHEEVEVEEGAEPGGAAVLDVHVEQVEHGLGDGGAAVAGLGAGEGGDGVEVLAEEASGELDDGHDHAEGGALEGHESPVHVGAQGVGDGEEALGRLGLGRGGQDGADDLDEELLGVAGAVVEAYGLEDEALQADDDLALGLEYLRLTF